MQDNIRKSLNNKQKTVTLFLDIEKAYDMLWKEGLLYKLFHLGIRGKMFNWIQSFLKNRLIQVKINDSFSQKYEVQNGTPQGSCLSPILFLIMINDITIPDSNVRISLFADDIALWISGKNTEYCIKTLQNTLDVIHSWTKQWGFNISIVKSKAMIFANNQPKKEVTKFKLEGNIIEYVEKFKFLGLIFDSQLNWSHHINYIYDSCMKRINLLRCISGTKWGANRKILYNLYTALIRSKIDYGCEFYNSTSLKNKKKLDLIQSICLRICSGAFRSTAINVLQITNHEFPLELRLNKQPLMKNTLKFISEDQLNSFYDNHKIQSEVIQIPIWHIPDIKYNLELVNKINKINDPINAKLVSMECINQYVQELHIYTDGSKQLDNTVSSALYIPKFNIKISKRIPNNCSIYTAELSAIYLALNWIREVRPYSTVIFTDSLRAISTLLNIRQNLNNSPIIKETAIILTDLFLNLNNVIFTWIPSHTNILGNDIVDNLAKNTCKSNLILLDIPLNKNEIIIQIHVMVKNKWREEYNNSNKGKFFKKLNQILIKLNL